MLRLSNVKVQIDADDDASLKSICAKILNVNPDDMISCRAVRCSLDARKKSDIHFLYTMTVCLNEKTERAILRKSAPNVSLEDVALPRELVHGTRRLCAPIVVVGMGPAGLFAAYELALAGYKPIIIERGKTIEQRAMDVTCFWKNAKLDVDSNVMFGEGGAGAFSDGKLTTRIKDPLSHFVIDAFCSFGAPKDISVMAKPHIGTDVLRRVISSIRQKLIALGVEMRFSTKLTGLIKTGNELVALKLYEINTGHEYTQQCGACILAIGQGARDTYRMLNGELELLPKPFAVGVRIEHPQKMINESQFGAFAANPRLGAAEYRMSHSAGTRAVYTFCMCPGGYVVASSSGEGQVVTNGMSNYKRDAKNANSAIVVQVVPDDFGNDALLGLEFQESMENSAFKLGGGDYCAPVQTVASFLNRQSTNTIGAVNPTYTPGIKMADVHRCLPEFVSTGIDEGIHAFGRQIKGFDMPDAIITAVESRTSSPVRIARDATTGESTRLLRLYPIGEGAGYAGGIVSAAVDGINSARKIISAYAPNE